MKFKPVLTENQAELQILAGQLVIDLTNKQVYIDKDNVTRVAIGAGTGIFEDIYTKEEVNDLFSWSIED